MVEHIHGEMIINYLEEDDFVNGHEDEIREKIKKAFPNFNVIFNQVYDEGGSVRVLKIQYDSLAQALTIEEIVESMIIGWP